MPAPLPSSGGPVAPPTVITGRPNDLGIEARDIDLTAAGLGNGALLTDQLVGSQRMAFQGARYFRDASGGGAFNAFTALYGTPALQNGLAGVPTPSVTMQFTNPVLAVGFNLFAVQFDPSFVASGLASDPSFTVRYVSGEERLFTSTTVQDPTPYRLLPPALRPDPLWWVFEGGGAISSLTVHAPVFFASRISPTFADVYGDLYFANLQVLDVPEPILVPEPGVTSLLLLAGLAMLRRRRTR